MTVRRRLVSRATAVLGASAFFWWAGTSVDLAAAYVYGMGVAVVIEVWGRLSDGEPWSDRTEDRP